MTDQEILELKELVDNNETVIYKNDLKEGNVLCIDDDIALYMDFTNEIEQELYLDIENSQNFYLIL